MKLVVVPNEFTRDMTSALLAADPALDVRVWPEIGEGAGIAYAACGTPPDGLFERLPDLEVMFSFAAGVDQLDFGAIPQRVAVARMVDDSLTRGIVEYALAAVMTIHRDFLVYRDRQSRYEWRRQQQRRAEDRRIGILGFGVLGQAIGRALLAVGFPVSGWSRSPKGVDGIDCVSGRDGLDDMLERTNILLSILPATPETRGLIDGRLLARLPLGASVISMGRGAPLVELDLVAALDAGHLSTAVLDVFHQEPLPADSPLWSHPRVLITPHVASGVKSESAARSIVARLRRHAAGQGLDHVVDRGRGY